MRPLSPILRQRLFNRGCSWDVGAVPVRGQAQGGCRARAPRGAADATGPTTVVAGPVALMRAPLLR